MTVGLIDSTWGGTPAEAWTSFQGLTSDASLMPVFSAWGAMMDGRTDMELVRPPTSARTKQPKKRMRY